MTRFPVLLDWREQKAGLIPRDVPWALVAGHEEQAHLNHRQTLQRLAQRGGLCPQELWCVVHDKSWRLRCGIDEAVAWLRTVA